MTSALATVVLLAAQSTSWSAVDDRLDALAKANQPLVVHVVVALADNANQGIVPVPKALGNGQDPQRNLYWGARYGVSTWLMKDAGWKRVANASPPPAHVLERLVVTKTIERDGITTSAFVVADAWNGAFIRDATERFLAYAAGRASERIVVGDRVLEAGGGAPLVAWVGHDGLMDFRVDAPKPPAPGTPPRGAIVLACISRRYFGPHLASAGAVPVLTTTGLMAPEAYVLDAALASLLAGGRPEAAKEAAATSYDRFQKCGLRGARRLFAD